MALEHDDNTIYPGAQGATLELPEGLDFGDDVIDDDQEADDDGTDAGVETGDDVAGDTADAADDGGGADGAAVDAPGDGADRDDADQPADDAGAAAEDDQQRAKKTGKEPLIPKSRFDQALRKGRVAEERAADLERQIAELRAAQADATAPKPLSAEDIQARMTAANEALIGGDTAKAAELQAEVLAALAPKPQAPAAPAQERDVVADLEARIEFKAVLAEAYERFPELDENSEAFDEELAAESVDLQQSYMRRGYTSAEATRKAAEAVARLHDLEDRKAPAQPAVNPQQKALEGKTQQKIAKALKAPPPLTGKATAEGAEKLDIHKLSEAEFLALPDAVQERLLGNKL